MGKGLKLTFLQKRYTNGLIGKILNITNCWRNENQNPNDRVGEGDNGSKKGKGLVKEHV